MQLFVGLRPLHILIIWFIIFISWTLTFNSVLYYVTFGILYFTTLGWVFLIGKIFNGLNNKTPIENYRENLWFILAFLTFLPNIYLFKNPSIPEDLNYVLLIVLSSIYCLSLFKTLNFAAKSYRQYETGLNLSFIQYFMYFLMFCYIFIAVFFVQSKINRIFKEFK